MAVEGWVVALVVGITAVQLLAYQYLRNRYDAAPMPEGPPDRGTAGTGPGNAAVRQDGSGSPTPEEGARCPTCGAVNQLGFRFCRRCVARIGG